MKIILLTLVTLGGAMTGFLVGNSLFFRRLSRDEMSAMGLFLPVMILLVGIIGAAVGALLGLTTGLAGMAWGIPGTCGAVMAWGIGIAAWLAVRWFSDHARY
jgi:hypothetical protein